MRQPFLKQVAEIYTGREGENLVDYCFVFPNKRSATFFTAFMSKAIDNDIIAPATATISDLVASFSNLIEANRYEQLFTLFKAYSDLTGVDIDFDSFLFWGEMIINDFNDVDRYLVNPETLFVNLTRLREISSNYITPDQAEIISRFWGEESPHQHLEHFWNHISYENDDSDAADKRGSFLKLWEVMLPLYESFNSSLAERGLASSGSLYRNAADSLRDSGVVASLPFKRYIFVGFNVLSTSEIKIFSRLKALGLADFYWDFNSPALRMTDNRARRFIVRNIEEFPSLYPLPKERIETIPEIRILGIPSFTGQVKAASRQLSQWLDDKQIRDPKNAIDTAVVLPDENLFIPMIHSVPEAISTMNVTMGYPLRLCPVASIIKKVISLQLRSRKLRGERTFFYEDVKPLLAMPVINRADPEGVDRLMTQIQQRRLFQISAKEIAATAPALAPVFNPLGDLADIDSVDKYVEDLCNFLSGNTDSNDRMGLHFIEAYRMAARRMCQAARDFNISMTGFALFHLVERALSSDTVSFIGEPLAGLQIMGVLETRALDFDNVILLSMNERIFPRKHYTRSFIPDTLRKAYGMATLDFQESIYAYYFYRLLSRANNATLIYDARRVGGARSNEMSRYLSQLLYMFGSEKVSHSLGIYSARPYSADEIVVPKTERISRLLCKFKAGEGSCNLSASSINDYIACPLNFYLKHVEGFNGEDEITDYVDASTFGTIVHEVMQLYYQKFQTKNPDGTFQPATITDRMLRDTIESRTNVELDKLITATINRCYNHLPEEKLDTPLAGETLVLANLFRPAVIEMLKHDLTLTPFTYVAAEYSMKGTLEISPDLKINVRQIIDRIDITDGDRMRFVDYKTGSDELATKDIASLFDGEMKHRPKAIMQLFLYCHIYNRLNHDDRPITPVIYKMRTIKTNGITPLKFAKEDIEDYHEHYDEFVSEFNKKVAEIFDLTVPFRQTQLTDNCTFCQFKSICSRENCNDNKY